MNESAETETQLLLRAQRGDGEALNELVRRYSGAVYSFVLRRVSDPDDAADAAQEVLLEAFSSLPSVREPAKFGAWLRSIAAHVCADWHAVRRRRVERPLSHAARPAKQKEELDELRCTVHGAMASLSHANRLAVTMFYFDGLSCREVAEFCDVGVSAIKSRLHEARKQLKKEIKKMEREQTSQKAESRPEVSITYSGTCDVDVLFRSPTKKHCAASLYSAIYPESRLADENVWHGWDDPECVDQLRRLWNHVGVIRIEDDRVLGLVPVYTAQDHERFAAWHARASRAMVERLKQEEDVIGDLVRDFEGECTDKDNLRRITILGRIIARGVEDALHSGLFESAHDWGGLGRAFIWGQCPGLGPAGGYSIHTCGAVGAEFSTFQQDRKFPGMDVITQYGQDAALGLLARLCRSPENRDGLLADVGEDAKRAGRFAAMLERLVSVRWVKEHDHLLTPGLPYLPWSGPSDRHRLNDLSRRLVEPVADAADELKALAAQSSFAHCRFADVAYMITAKMRWYVVRDLTRQGLIVPQPDPIPPGWGAWLYLTEGV